MNNPFKRQPTGEISHLRTYMPQFFSYITPYTLDSSRVDYKLARALYNNTADGYKLGAGFAKPIVNTTAGFMGVPHFSHDDPDAGNAIETMMDKWSGKILRVNRDALRDGDAFVRISLGKSKYGDEQTFDMRAIPPDWVTPVPDPLTGSYQEVVIRYPIKITDKDGRVEYEYTLTEILTADTRTIEYDTRAPANLQAMNKTEPNPWGFVPIVHFKNESEETQLYGNSELEPVEPFMKVYHDTMLFAAQGSKLFSRPKAKFKLSDVKTFLKNNFSPQEIESGRLKFADKEIFMMHNDDDASFITADSGLNGITTLLEFIFYCIVDVSETPEFAFGTAVASSKASVSEQMVPLARKIRRKRGMFEEYYTDLGSMFLAMWAKTQNTKLSAYDVNIDWDEISPRDDSAVATTIKTLVDGLSTAVETGLMSVDAASDFLREFVPSMLPWLDPDADDDEQRRVMKSMLFRKRIEDGEGFNEQQEQEING